MYPSPLPIFKWFTCLLNSELEVYHSLITLQAELCSFLLSHAAELF